MRTLNQTWKDYKKPVPKKWRMIGDFSLILLLALQPFIITAPLKEEVKWYLSVVFTILLISFKFWTNTKIENEQIIRNTRTS